MKIAKLKHFRDNEDLNPRLKMVESVLGNWDDWFLSPPLFFGSLVMHIASRQTQLITGLPQAILSFVLQRIRRGLQSETSERHFLMEGSSWLGSWGGGEEHLLNVSRKCKGEMDKWPLREEIEKKCTFCTKQKPLQLSNLVASVQPFTLYPFSFLHHYLFKAISGWKF